MGIEYLNNLLYDSKAKVLRTLKVLSMAASITALALIIYENGFPLTEAQTYRIRSIFDIIFGVFAFNYFTKLLYSFERKKFIQATWFEGLVMTLILIVGVSKYIFDINLFQYLFHYIGVSHSLEYYRLFITFSMLYIVGFEFIKFSEYINRLTLQPASTFIWSFLILISIGTGLLLLPACTTHQDNASFMEAFFTSVSASCVTGLIIVDTGTFFSLKGHIIIIFLMQLGGIGMISFATFFASFLKKGVGLKHQVFIQDFLSSESLFSAKSLLRQIILITVTIEIIVAIMIFFTWGGGVTFHSLEQKIFYSIFHAVSAFCNAGFALFPNSLFEEGLRNSYLLHLVIAFAIIIGGIGFSTIQDILSPKALRERLEKPWKDWKLSTKIAIYTSLLLITLGAVLILILEYDNPETMADQSLLEKMIASFFQSVTSRTAGFNTLDYGALTQSTLILTIFLMFIGASSGSTGGGIKTSTFLIIAASSIATIRGRNSVDLGKRQISIELINKAYSIFLFAATYNLIMIFILSVTDPTIPIMNLVFEQISAFGTVGLSTGITADLSTTGKCVLITSMFIGRVGTLTLALALSTKAKTNNYQYPTAHLMVG